MSRTRGTAGTEAEGNAAGTRPAAAGMSARERNAWWALLAVALLLRVIDLGARPLHHDESVHAWFEDRLARDGEYKYDPVYHGPVQYAMVSSTFLVARAVATLPVVGPILGLQDTDPKGKDFNLARGDFFARLPAALGGVALVAMALLLRPRFGAGAAFASGALVALSPNLLYYTRFCREDIWSLLGTAGLFLYFDAWFREGRLKDLVLCAFWAAIAFAAKENFYVLMALMGPSVVAFCWEPGKGLDVWRRLHRLLDFLERHQAALAGALLLFFIVSELLYTVFLVHPDSGNPARDAITYWWGQHKQARVGGPKTYHLPRLAQYEFAILIPAFAWLYARRKELNGAERFLGALGFSSILMYAYLGEKTPWLIVHQILPFVPLAGLAWARLAEKAMGWRFAGTAMAAASAVTAVSLSFLNPALSPRIDRAESVVYVQTSPEVLGVVRDIRAAARAGADPAASIEGEANWPFNWYVRRLPVSWTQPTADRKPAVAVVDSDKADKVAETLGLGYTREEIPLRSWWLPEVRWSLTDPRPTPRELLTYLFTRKPWSIVGSQNVVVFRRADLPRE